jgi:hypothetical protein
MVQLLYHHGAITVSSWKTDLAGFFVRFNFVAYGKRKYILGD